MVRKPAGLTPEYAAQFSDECVVAAYHHRPAYPAETFDILTDLLPRDNQRVLDIGCGTGDIARPLAARVTQVDAVDISRPMLERGRNLPGGIAPNLRWLHARVEDVALDAPYGMVTAGESLHWMDWDIVLPKIGAALEPDGYLVLLGRHWEAAAWSAALANIIPRYTTNRDYVPYDLVDELRAAGLFTLTGRHRTAIIPHRQPLDAYVESMHSRNGFSRDRMPPASAAAFDREMRAAVEPFIQHGIVELALSANILWGRPRTPDRAG